MSISPTYDIFIFFRLVFHSNSIFPYIEFCAINFMHNVSSTFSTVLLTDPHDQERTFQRRPTEK